MFVLPPFDDTGFNFCEKRIRTLTNIVAFLHHDARRCIIVYSTSIIDGVSVTRILTLRGRGGTSIAITCGGNGLPVGDGSVVVLSLSNGGGIINTTANRAASARIGFDLSIFMVGERMLVS